MTEDFLSDESPIGGDVLEEIITHVPLVDLVSANNVSSSWRSAISSSLLRLNTLKPWLLIHSQSTRSPSAVTTLAYDPRSHLLMHFQQSSSSTTSYFALLRSSNSSLLYMLSSSRFAFSTDPLHLTWQQAPPPIGWRPDPVVAKVGDRIVVAGSGACSGIRQDIPPLEIYNTTTRTWEWCDSMPTELMDSAASTWVSVAADQNKMYVSVKSSGVAYWFDPRGKTWCGPYDVRAGIGESVFFSVIGCGGNGMVVVGLTGEAEDVRSVVMWEVEGGDQRKWKLPFELMEKLKGESSWYMPSISLNVMGDFAFVHNPLEPREIIVCELLKGTCRWGSVTAAGFDDGCRFRNLVLSCSNVTLAHLEQAFRLNGSHSKHFRLFHFPQRIA